MGRYSCQSRRSQAYSEFTGPPCTTYWPPVSFGRRPWDVDGSFHARQSRSSSRYWSNEPSARRPRFGLCLDDLVALTIDLMRGRIDSPAAADAEDEQRR
jgi:hypothetical protein